MTARELAALLCGVAIVLLLATSALPQTPNGEWFRSLTNPVSGQRCCDEADGEFVEWDMGPNGYRVFLMGAWRDVPATTVLRVPNRHGQAIVWWYPQTNVLGVAEPVFRCFLPGAGL